MNATPNLHIDEQLDEATQTLTLVLKGDVDVTAGGVLDGLPAVPEGHKVVLDFEAVERVNSMGLAQLMRCLEAWKQQGVSTEAIKLNRMVSMLFKMTGLNRYFGGEGADVTPPPAPATSEGAAKPARSRSAQFRRVKRNKPAADESAAESATNTTEKATKPPAPVSQASATDKMQFSVSLQNNQQLTGWYFLNTLLQRRLDRPVSMDITQLGQEAALHENALVFAKPFDACSLISKHGYIPIARPHNDSVEVSIVVRTEDQEKALKDFAGAGVATSAKNSFVFLLGRFFCDEYELDSSSLSYQFTGNQLTAMRRLLEKDVDMLFMLKENYNLLSALSREGTQVLEESETGMAYHMLLLSPAFSSLESDLRDFFLNLQSDVQGSHALKDLAMESWSQPEPDEIAMLQMLYDRYVD
ncbi:STAS domain-containing protein [Leucothrix sargassi]|nr:STAS domain-containing protein [Leucothrix sargassi]